MGEGIFIGEEAESAICGFFCIVAITTSAIHVRGHLKSFSRPDHQTHIVRILLMVPVYALGSWLSLTFHEYDLYFDSIRDCYEAFTIYSFLQLLLAYIGSESTVCEHYREKEHMERSWMTGSCCIWTPFVLDKSFLRGCKQGAIQFVIAKPIIAAIILGLDLGGMYMKDHWGPQYGFVWVQVLYNISYSWALYALALFYQSTSTLLKPYSPVKKFVMVKLIVFVSFWQGLIISLLVSFGTVNDPGIASRLQGFLICIEMAFAAALHLYAFPVSEYSGAGVLHTNNSAISNLGQTINMADVVNDTVNNFTEQYREYEMQGHKDASEKSPQHTERTVQRSYIISQEGIERLQQEAEGRRREDSNCALMGESSLHGGIDLEGGIDVPLDGAHMAQKRRDQEAPRGESLNATEDQERDDVELL